MKSSYWKIVFRSIKGSLMRYLAILMIIALGVGFFAGLKSTMPAFYATGEKYIRNQQLFDFRILSTIGLDEEDGEKIGELPGIQPAERGDQQDREHQGAGQPCCPLLRPLRDQQKHHAAEDRTHHQRPYPLRKHADHVPTARIRE